MKHARKDYDRIQDPYNLIPEDEPVFLLRGQDTIAPAAVRLWATIAEHIGVDTEMVEAAHHQAEAMEEWQQIHGKKTPDMEPNRGD